MTKTRKPIAHRGRKHPGPGNTLAEFQELLAFDPEAEAETDVRFTWKKRKPVLHDTLLEAATNGEGWANLLGLDELADLRVKHGGQVTEHKVPELEDVVRLFNGHGVIHLELKYGPGDPPGLLPAVLEVLERFPAQQVELSSFYHPALLRVPSRIKIGVLTNTMLLNTVGYLRDFLVDGRTPDTVAWHPDINNIYWDPEGPDLVAAVQAQGHEVRAYTVNPGKMFDWTFEHGIRPISDFYAEAVDYLARKSA
jgi:glycerophosphoryl diester phosphodiesterase